ncbi:MAG: Phosphatidylinositol phosphate synthase @ Archaetidylinositol phosphate synthase, partial [uncultured Solirubrobacteraceae bacterium]
AASLAVDPSRLPADHRSAGGVAGPPQGGAQHHHDRRHADVRDRGCHLRDGAHPRGRLVPRPDGVLRRARRQGGARVGTDDRVRRVLRLDARPGRRRRGARRAGDLLRAQQHAARRAAAGRHADGRHHARRHRRHLPHLVHAGTRRSAEHRRQGGAHAAPGARDTPLGAAGAVRSGPRRLGAHVHRDPADGHGLDHRRAADPLRPPRDAADRPRRWRRVRRRSARAARWRVARARHSFL